jgi:hypothetical protein
MDEFFGNADTETKRRPTLAVPGRALNTIEIELRGLMAQEPDAPAIWLDGDDDAPWTNAAEWETFFGTSLSLAEVLKLDDILQGKVIAKYAKQIVIARELGNTPTIELYRIACEVEGIPPLI